MMGEIENAMIARLRLATKVDGLLGYRIPTIDSYGEELGSETLRLQVATLPSVWFTFMGAEATGDDDQAWSGRFVAVAAAGNARNERASRLGAAGAVGVYQIAKDLRGLFKGHQLGLPIEPLTARSIRLIKSPILVKNGVNVLAVEFVTGWYEGAEFEAPALITAENEAHEGDPDWIVRRQLGDFTTFNVKWEPPVPSDVEQTIDLSQEAP